jgi:hypothetical protein
MAFQPGYVGKNMPQVTREARRTWGAYLKKEILAVFRSALRKTLKIPDSDRNVSHHAWAPEDFDVPPW